MIRFLTSLFACIVISCGQEYHTEGFFPVKEGYVWKYAKYFRGNRQPNDSLIVQVISTQPDQGKNIATFRYSIFSGDQSTIYERRYRIAANGDVYDQHDNAESILYKFSANDEDVWFHRTDNPLLLLSGEPVDVVHRSRVLSRLDSLTFQGQRVNCVTFEFTDTLSSHGQYIQSFARNIGMVEMKAPAGDRVYSLVSFDTQAQ